MDRNQKWAIIARFSLIIVVMIVALWACNATPQEAASFESDYTTIDVQWEQVIGDTRIALDSYEDIQAVEIGETIVLEGTLPKIHPDEKILFYSENQEVEVFVDGECIYSFVMQEEYEILQTPGSAWNEVSTTSEMSGQTIRIEYTCNFTYYQLELHECYLADSSDIVAIKIQKTGLLIVIALIILILAITSYVNGYIWKRELLKNIITNMADLYLCVALWLFAELNMFDFFFHRPILSYVMAMLLLRILPITMWKHMKSSLPRQYGVMKFLGVLSWMNLLITCFLQLFIGISFVQLLILNNAVITIGGAIIIGVYIDCIAKMRRPFTINDIFVLNVLLVIAGVIDVITYYFASDYAVIMGGVSAVVFIIYAIIIHIVLVRYETRINQEKASLEEDYKKLHNVSLMQQIKAHFIFNTLNTISSLCKYDAQAADKATKLFSRYMRAYMNLINCHDNIPFDSELSLVEAYLDIEKLRFGEGFTYELDLMYRDFVLPPLSLQPIVENAVNHGVRKQVDVGVIKITTKKEEDYVKVVVEDNGVGFNLNKLESTDSIGIRNMRTRVAYMTSGTVDIESTINEGTRVVISLPLKEKMI